jgi:cytochrome c oxidase assembly protein subunit 15
MAHSSTISPALAGHAARDDARLIGFWLVGVAGLVLAMMVIGAITRLTGSGLSMVEWRPLMGILPPLTDAEWQRVFDLYRQTSQYRLANWGMSLGDFQTIFWWEYIHRVWGRLIGLAFALPLVVFLIRGGIPAGYRRHLVTLLVLGGLQGLVGWWMVTSGFVDRTDVSQYRLATHLGIAFVILGYLLYVALKLLKPRAAAPAGAMVWRRPALGFLALTGVTVLAGALVAGMDAGLTYNTWPLMDGDFFYRNWAVIDPLWRNAFENLGAVQFNHRMLAYGVLLAALALWWMMRRSDTVPGPARLAIAAIALMTLAQLGLGIATLLTGVNIVLAVLHQAGAAILVSLAVWLVYETRAARPETSRP